MVDMGLFCMEFEVGVGWNTSLGRAKESEWAFGMCGLGYLGMRILLSR